MGSFSALHWLVVAVVVLVLFGRGKISETMGDFGKGISSFRKGMAEGEAAASKPAEAPPQQIAPPAGPTTESSEQTKAQDPAP